MPWYMLCRPVPFRSNNLKEATEFSISVSCICMPACSLHYKACVIVPIIITNNLATLRSWCGKMVLVPHPCLHAFSVTCRSSHGYPREKWTKLNMAEKNAFLTSALCDLNALMLSLCVSYIYF